MKSSFWALLSVPLFPVLFFGQTPSSPVCGNPDVNNPEFIERIRLSILEKHSGSEFTGHPEFIPGAIDTFFVYNFTSSSFDLVPAELKASGSLSHVWVSLEELQNTHVDSSVIVEVLTALESRTPAASRDSTQGILQLMRTTFGDPPNINSDFVIGAGDGRTHFLLCDIKDGWSPDEGGSFVAGFFIRLDVDPSSGSVAFSNRRDMLYIDSYPGIFHNDTRSTGQVLGTLAHEFQHLIHWNHDPDEGSTFFNEGLSEYSSYVCGYGLRPPADYFENTNVGLLGWSSELADYSRAAVWTLYLAEQFGDVFIGNFTRDPLPGLSGFQSAISQSGLTSSFDETVLNFHVANILQKRSVNSAHGYLDSTAVLSRPRFFASSFSSFANGSRSTLYPLSADYLRFFAPDTLEAVISTTGGMPSATILEFRDQSVSMNSMTLGSPYAAVFPGAVETEAHVILHNPSETSNAAYSYSVTGKAKEDVVVELANDDGVSHSLPNTLFVQGDTAFVVFEGIDGGIIDSVAFWFGTTGSARVFIRDWNTGYDFDGQPLGGLGGSPRMVGTPVAFTVSDTGFFRTVVNFQGLNVYSGPDFVVELIYGAGAPNPLLRRDASQAVLRSFLSLQQQPTPGRRVYASFGDFYVRSYLSASNEPPSPPVIVPNQFALYQNYPNPFNPATTIRYDIPVRAHVKLVLYDILGREVAVLKDEEQGANRYTIEFDGSGFVSGVYFVRLKTPGFEGTKKLVLVR